MASFNDNTFTSADTDDLQNDYFDCLIECTTDNSNQINVGEYVAKCSSNLIDPYTGVFFML